MKAINRLFQYIDNKSIKPTRLEKEIGLSNGYLGTQLKREADLGEGVLNKIVDYCLDISPEWLLTGRGQMLRDGQPDPAAPPPAIEAPPPKVIYESDPRDIRLIEALERDVKHLERDIKHLESLAEEAIATKNKTIEDCQKSIEDRDKYVALLECRLATNGSEPTQSEDLDPARYAMESSYIAPGKKSISTSRG